MSDGTGPVTGSVQRAGAEWLQYDYASTRLVDDEPRPVTMWRYRALLPVGEGPVRYPLPIGGTPLLPSPALRASLGMPGLWLKDETRGPSASNKDRATALVIEGGLRGGVDTITTASTGNAAISTAFGAAAAGLRAAIFVSTGCRPDKLALMAQAGAWVFRVSAGYAAAVDLSRTAARAFGWLDRNTGANPVTVEAKKTVAFEVWEQLGRRPPDAMVAPVGDGPTLAALDKGFDELVRCGVADRRPRLIGVQADRCQPLVQAWRGGVAGPAQLDPAGTVADGIAVLRPAIGQAVLAAVGRDGGGMVAVDDDALLRAVDALAARAGVGAEPAGAAALAGLHRALEVGLVHRDETVVLLVTGRELKAAGGPVDGRRVRTVERLDEVEKALAGGDGA
jgi:threonine synthase